jgi:hypothetical protein
MAGMQRLAAETQTLYAELGERLRALDTARSLASLRGGFARKRVAGGDYWYFKTSAGPAGQSEYFVGPDDEATRAAMRAYAAGRAEAEAAEEGVARLCAMLRQGGATLLDAASAKVIAGLANAGVFRLGAVLVGTHAYAALANVLGVRWASALRTQDVDLAAARSLQVAVPQAEADLPGALQALNMGFLPVPGLDPKRPQTSFKVRGHALRVDLLTPARGARDGRPVLIPRLKAAAQPLEMLDYLLEAPLAAPLLNGGATLVNLPDPARFALHKLLVSARRPAVEQAKAAKDRQQAAELIALLHEDRRGDLEQAAAALRKRPATWRARLAAQLRKLPDESDAARRAVLRALGQ